MKLALLLVAAASLLAGAHAAEAQPGSRPPQMAPPPDSGKVYVYVAQMPVYPGGQDALLADLRRELRVASAAAGCTLPALPLYVGLLVGPSGCVYAARSLPGKGGAGRQQLAAAAPCEAAIGTAARRLRRLQPGRQANKPVTVELLVKLPAGSQ